MNVMIMAQKCCGNSIRRDQLLGGGEEEEIDSDQASLQRCCFELVFKRWTGAWEESRWRIKHTWGHDASYLLCNPSSGLRVMLQRRQHSVLLHLTLDE